MPASATTVTAASLRSCEQALEGVLQRFELGVAADHASGHAFDAARADAELARLGAGDKVARTGASTPLTASGACASTSNMPRTWA